MIGPGTGPTCPQGHPVPWFPEADGSKPTLPADPVRECRML